MIFQNGTSSYGGRRKLPRVLTEHGILMLSSVLRSKVAIDISIQIMRTFIEIRKFLLTNSELAVKYKELEDRVVKRTAKMGR